jgi:transglutaminase-like putative cysteine protease
MKYTAILGSCLLFFIQSPAGAADPDTRQVTVTFQYVVTPDVPVRPGQVTVTALVPRTIDRRQKVLKIDYTPKPASVFDEKSGRYARFLLENPKQPVTITIRADLELYRYDLDAAEAAKGPRVDDGPAPATYLGAEKYLEITAAPIRTAAREVKGTDPIDTIRKTVDFVSKTLTYTGYNSKDIGAVGALQQKKGDCTEFTDLFVALCRVNGIATRSCDGYLVDAFRKGDTPKHAWAEVFLQKLGWVPIDPLHIARGLATVDRRQNEYIYLSYQRNDVTLNHYHYYAYVSKGMTVKVADSFAVKDLTPATK